MFIRVPKSFERMLSQAIVDAPPHWTHDCTKCVYLGGYCDSDYEQADLYWCNEQIGGPTVIVRFGDDGPEYSSGMVFADNGMNKALVEAKKRAISKGLPVSR